MRSIFLEKPDALEIRLKTSGWGQLGVWLPVMVAAAVIATESTNAFSSAHTSEWLRPVFEAVLGHLKNATWDTINHLLRKSGHVCGYGLVCVTFLRAWLLELAGITDVGETAWRVACLRAGGVLNSGDCKSG